MPRKWYRFGIDEKYASEICNKNISMHIESKTKRCEVSEWCDQTVSFVSTLTDEASIPDHRTTFQIFNQGVSPT